jgi:hypothetical protein
MNKIVVNHSSIIKSINVLNEILNESKVSILDDPEFFVTNSACDQNAVDMFNWISQIPVASIKSGGMLLFSKENDLRVSDFSNTLGSIKNKTILELGSFEGGHTFQLENAGAQVVPVEANPANFLKSLIAKNILNMKSSFLLGDFVSFIDNNKISYDGVFAAGVLYHMQDPIGLIHKISNVTKNIYIWTLYVDDNQQQQWNKDDVCDVVHHDQSYKYYKYVYPTDHHTRQLAGTGPYCSRITKNDLLKALYSSGFKNIKIHLDDASYAGGANISLTASF